MKSLLASTLLVLLASGLTHAQFITWSTPALITGDSDILTTGTYLDAVKTAGTGAGDYTTGNGVIFHTHSASGAFSDGTIAISGDGPNTNSGIGTASTTDPAYNAVLSGILYFYTGTATPPVGTATFSGLTAGDNYRIQVWNAEGANSGYPPSTYTGSSGGSVSFANNYAIGTFVAGGSTASFSITDGGGFPMISAVSIYDVSEVPEPSTYLMGGLGLLALAGIRRFRLLGA